MPSPTDAGAGPANAKAGTVTPFRIDVPQADLDDLQRRLAATRWPDELPGAAREYGIPLTDVRELAAYWRDGYDWRRHEARLNAVPQFTTVIDGQRVHFLHARSPHPGALPLILTHGWPGSVLEFLAMIGPLTDPAAHGGDPADAFHVVVPSIPGYGFSGPTTQRGWTPARVSAAWAVLMDRLGYRRYGAQGGDWGSVISRELGRLAPGQVAGVHLNFLTTPPDGDPAALSDEDRVTRDRLHRFRHDGSGYFRVHSTRPQTLAYAMSDSPTGLLAWIAEKFSEWSDPASVISRDDLLTNVMLYWLTGTAGAAMRLYWEAAHLPPEPQPSSVPTGIAIFPHEIAPPIRRIAAAANNIVHWSPQPRGGHFAALEEPGLLTGDVRAFFRGLR
jgi:pimeloyl-ACP methyl ester carboxylesterase